MAVNRAAACLVLSAALALSSGVAEAHDTMVTCVNPASGASWRVHIDYDKRTVDDNAASISDSEILWKDSGGNHYTLDRKSGNLTQITPSSTGGYFLYDRCKLG